MMRGGNNTWWKVDEDHHKGVDDVLQRLAADVNARNERWRRYLSILLNKTVSGFTPGARVSEEEAFKSLMGGEPRLVLNPIEQVLATLAARISTQLPRAQFLTDTDGPDGWSMKLKAEGYEKFVAGEWYRCRVQRLAALWFVRAGAVGFGAMKAYESADHRLGFESTPPWELIVDEQAAISAAPRCLYQVGYWPAEVLIAQYPASEESIANETGRNLQSRPESGTATVTDLVEVREAWHLPSSEGAFDGKHVVTLQKATLTPIEEQGWELNTFPFSFFSWDTPVIGWYPAGLVEKEEPLQKQANKLFGRIQDAMHLYSQANTYVEEGSVKKGHLKNSPGNIVTYKKGSAPPKTEMPASVSSEVFRFVWELISHIFQDAGVSQLAAQSVKPAGIESGRALRVLADQESGRHAGLNRRWDDAWLDLAELTVAMAAQIAKRNPKWSTNYKKGSKIERIKWADVNLDRDCYELQVFPSSMLPYQPAGRLAAVEEMIQAGFVDQAQGKALLNFPDLEQFHSLELAGQEDIDWMIERMLVHGEWHAPEPYQSLAEAIPRMQSAVLRARMQGAPEERRQLILDWIEQAVDILQPQVAPAPAMPPGGPPMQPEPPMPGPPGPMGPAGQPMMPGGLPPGVM